MSEPNFDQIAKDVESLKEALHPNAWRNKPDPSDGSIGPFSLGINNAIEKVVKHCQRHFRQVAVQPLLDLYEKWSQNFQVAYRKRFPYPPSDKPLADPKPITRADVDKADEVIQQIEVRLYAREQGESSKKTEPTRKKMSKSAAALALLVDHPEWSNQQIADAAGCHVKSLSRNVKFKAAREMVKEAGKKAMLRSERSRGPDLDEYGDDGR